MYSSKRKFKKSQIILLLLFVIALLVTLLVYLYHFNAKKVVTTMNQVEIYNEPMDFSTGVEQIIPEATIENLPSIQEEKETESSAKTTTLIASNSSPYYIKVNYQANTVTIYTKNEKGEYTNPFKAMVCSTGTYTPTSGQYKIQYRWKWLRLVGNVYGQYSTQIVGDILFHSVPYLQKSEDTLEYWEFDKLGQTASAGCIRLQVCDAKWIYDNIPKGTIVEFYADTNPGPLGKPSAPKITSNEACRNWDPTDPHSNNLWNHFIQSSKPEEDLTLKDPKPNPDDTSILNPPPEKEEEKVEPSSPEIPS